MASTSTKAATTKSILKSATTLKGHEKWIRCISYFPDGQRMISGSKDKTARQWDLKACKEIEEARDVCEEEVLAVAVSRDGRWVVTAGGDVGIAELKACEVETGIVKTFKGHSYRITCIDISTDNKLLASGSYDWTARIWNLETGKLVAGPFKSVDWVGAVRFSTDSKKLAIKLWEGTYLEVWDIQTQKLDVRKGTFTRLGEITYAPIFWRNKNKNILAAFSFTDDEAMTIYEFDAATLETVGTPFKGHTKVVTGLALSSGGTLLASAASGDKTIKLWAFESRQILATFDVQNPYSIVLSPDSHQFAYATYYEIHICNIPPDVLAQARTSAQKKSTLTDVPRSDATRRPPAVRRRQPIPSLPISQRPPPTINPHQPIFLRLQKPLSFSSRKNAISAVQNNQTQDPPDFSATLPLPSNHLQRSPSTPLPNVRTFFNPNRSSSDKGKKRAREPKPKPPEIVDVPLGQATYADAVGVDDGKRPYVVFFCLSWFQKKEKKQIPRPVYDDELEDDDEEEEDILNRVAVPHTRVQHEGIELKQVASQSQPRAGPSCLVNNDDILNRVSMPYPRVRYDEISFKTVASQSQPEAGPSRLVTNDDILNRVAVPHPRVRHEEIVLKPVASQSQPEAELSRHVKNIDILDRVAVPQPRIDRHVKHIDILDRVAVPQPRVQHEEIELKPVVSRSQPEAGPSRLAMVDEHLEAQFS